MKSTNVTHKKLVDEPQRTIFEIGSIHAFEMVANITVNGI